MYESIRRFNKCEIVIVKGCLCLLVEFGVENILTKDSELPLDKRIISFSEGTALYFCYCNKCTL